MPTVLLPRSQGIFNSSLFGGVVYSLPPISNLSSLYQRVGLGFGILASIGMAVKGVLLDSSLLENAVSVEKLLVRLYFSKLELVSSSFCCLFGLDYYIRSGLSL